MLALVSMWFGTALVLVMVASAPAGGAPKATPPPTPQNAARAIMLSTPPPLAVPKKRDPTRLPSTYSLSRDPGYTPWSSFFALGDDAVGRWTLEGSSLGGGLRCGDLRAAWCLPLAEALMAFVWEPFDSPIGVFAGASLVSIANTGGEMQTGPGFTAGLRITPASWAAFVRRVRHGKK